MNPDIITLEQKLSILTINSEESFVLINTDYQIVAFNRQFKHQYLKYFGTSFEKGDSIFKLVNETRIDVLKKIYERVFAGSTESTELVVPLKDEKNMIILNKFKPAFDENGKIIGAFVTSTDITQLRELEEEKEEKRLMFEIESNNLKALINNTNDLIWSFNYRNEILSFNDSFSQFAYSTIGLKPEKGMNIYNFVQSIERQDLFKLHVERVYQGESFVVEDVYTEPKNRSFEISFNPITNHGKIIGVACFSRDITERKNNEKQLLVNENRLKRAQAIAHIGNWEKELDSDFFIWSNELYSIYGVEKESFNHQTQTWLDFVHPEDKINVLETIKKGRESLENYDLYFRIVRPNSEIRYIYCECIFDKSIDGNKEIIYGIQQDITHRKTNEIQLHNLLNESNKQNQLLKNFSQIVSHNIRTNSHNIRGLTEMLMESEDETEKEALLEMLSLSSKKLNDTVENLSEFLTFQNLKTENYKKINLKSEIEKTCSVINQSIKQNNVEIINKVDESIQIKGIQSYIDSILVNLISNAIKYRAKERDCVVEFEAIKKQHTIELTIKDNGIGIDLDRNKDKIFGLFNTFHNNKDAIGFGLYMVKNQIEAMKGTIEVDSEINNGTQFKIIFNEQT
jgi:PAS domain S-box-containing protein